MGNDVDEAFVSHDGTGKTRNDPQTLPTLPSFFPSLSTLWALFPLPQSFLPSLPAGRDTASHVLPLYRHGPCSTPRPVGTSGPTERVVTQAVIDRSTRTTQTSDVFHDGAVRGVRFGPGSLSFLVPRK